MGDGRRTKIESEFAVSSPSCLARLTAFSRFKGTVEIELLAEAARSKGRIELQITKPGAITDSQTPMVRRMMLPVLEAVLGLPSVHVSDIAAAELHQAINGTGGKDVVSNASLVELGGQALKEWGIERCA